MVSHLQCRSSGARVLNHLPHRRVRAEAGAMNVPPVVDESGRRQSHVGEDPRGQALFVNRRAFGEVRAHPEPAFPAPTLA